MIHVDRDLEFIPAIKKVNDKLKDLEDKVELVLSDLKLLIRISNKKVK